jgi:autotransporter-associated beta strand protein
MTTRGGDGAFLPFNPVSPVLGITKTFTTGIATSGAVTVSLGNGANGANNASINSRDRGSPTGATNNNDLYRDLVFLSRDTGTQVGGTPLIISLSGLNKNTTYRFTAYANDTFNLGQYVFGEVNSRPYDYAPAAEQDENNGLFANPPTPLDGSLIGPRITSGSGLLPVSSAEGFASSFQITTDNDGAATIYEWSNIGFTGNQGAAVFNGFKIDNVAASNWTAGSSTTWGAGFSGGIPDGDHAAANFGSIASAQTVTIEGAGRTVGVLNVASPNAYTISGGTLTLNDSFAPDPNLPPPPSTPPSLTSNTTGHEQINILGDSTFSVTHQISSPVVLLAQTTIKTAQSTTSLLMSGPISGGSRGINKMGSGVLTLSGNNTYGGSTNVFEGKLVVNGRHDGGGDYTIASGATLAGSGTITLRDDIQPRGGTSAQPGKISVWNAAAIAPGDTGIGTLTIDRLAIGSPAPHGNGSISLNIDLASGSADKLVVTDNNGVSFANTSNTVSINVSALAGAVAGTFPILDYAGSLLDNAGNPLADISRFTLSSNTAGGFSFALSNNAANTSIDLQVIAGGGGPSTWTGAVDNNWSPSGNWSGLVPNFVDATAAFGTVASGRYAVNVDGPKTVGTISFIGSNSYSLTGSAITMQAANGAPQINVLSGNHTIGSQVTLNNFLFMNVAANSTLDFTGTLNSTASGRQIGLNGAGTAQFVQLSVGTIVVNGTATMKISAKAAAADPTGTSRTSGVTLDVGAHLDLTNNILIADQTPLATIKAAVASGFAGGSWNGAGINSSSAATIAGSANTHKTALGYAEADQINDFGANPSFSFGGMTITAPTTVVVRYTLSGDANLDGTVNSADFSQIATGFNSSGKDWYQGDFNFDGVVNALDFNAVATNFGATPPPGAALGSLVPEPTMLAMLLAPALMMRRRRVQSRTERAEK